jgi:hypothetical protein
MSLYDKDVGKAVPKLLDFFGKHIGGETADRLAEASAADELVK